MQSTSGHGLDALGTTPATRLGSGGTTLIAPASATVQAATTRSSTLLYARPAFLSMHPIRQPGNGGEQRQSLRGWWNHTAHTCHGYCRVPARPNDSLRRLTLRHHHRTMSDELGRSRGNQMTSHTRSIGHGRRERGGGRWEQHGQKNIKSGHVDSTRRYFYLQLVSPRAECPQTP